MASKYVMCLKGIKSYKQPDAKGASVWPGIHNFGIKGSLQNGHVASLLEANKLEGELNFNRLKTEQHEEKTNTIIDEQCDASATGRRKWMCDLMDWGQMRRSRTASHIWL
jgi:hypothetical protein